MFIFGARPAFDPKPEPPGLPHSLEELDRWVARDAHRENVIAGTEKRLSWHNGCKVTDRAVVYLHGFSASRKETAPFTEKLAARLGANAFETRLRGHGCSDGALDDATAEQWLEDAIEAIGIGERIGKQVVIVGVSTGATLALLATQHRFLASARIAALVMISPNFQVYGECLLELPWSFTLLPRLIPYRTWRPKNQAHGTYWTTRYKTRVLFEMQKLVHAGREAAKNPTDTPIFVLACPDDSTVDFRATEQVFRGWRARSKEMVRIHVPPGRSTHVIAGDILNPSLTETLVDHTVRFLAAR